MLDFRNLLMDCQAVDIHNERCMTGLLSSHRQEFAIRPAVTFVGEEGKKKREQKESCNI